jgi:hypothetical protein
MATQILRGHFTAFYWGQVYGGSVEEIILAPFVAIFGRSGITLNVYQILLSAAAGLLTWRIAKRLVQSPWIAAFAAAVMWAAPQAAISNFTYEYGFRSVTLLCGLGALLVSLRLSDQENPSRWEFVAFGLLVGIGWWSSPEIVYLLIPAGLVLVFSAYSKRQSSTARAWLHRSLLALSAAVLGALPWLWANARSHLASLDTAKFEVPPGAPRYSGRLGNFPRHVLPMLLSLREQYSTSWLGGRGPGEAFFLLLIIGLGAALVVCLLAGGRYAALSIGVLAFPFLLAVSPATWRWEDGRYAVYVVPLVALVVAAAADLLFTRRHTLGSGFHRTLGVGSAAMIMLGVILCALSTWNFLSFVAPKPTADWQNPDSPSLAPVQLLEKAGITTGYADYWVAYRLDFLSDNRLALTVAGTDPIRWAALDRRVRSSTRSTWVFVGVSSASLQQFGETQNIQGPGGMQLASFLAYLKRQNISYASLSAGMITAITPRYNVSPTEVR